MKKSELRKLIREEIHSYRALNEDVGMITVGIVALVGAIAGSPVGKKFGGWVYNKIDKIADKGDTILKTKEDNEKFEKLTNKIKSDKKLQKLFSDLKGLRGNKRKDHIDDIAKYTKSVATPDELTLLRRYSKQLVGVDKNAIKKILDENRISLKENNYVVVSMHPKGGGFVMTTPTSKSKATKYAANFPAPKGEKQTVMSVDAAKKIKHLVGRDILDEADSTGCCGSITERLKKFKSPMELGQGRKGVYYLQSVGMDTNGNWSYMVSRGANRPKKIQHQGNWAEKIRKDDKEGDITDSKTAKQIIDYYESYIKESKQLNELRVDGREEYEGIRYNVMHQPPKGYFIKGDDAEGKKVFGKFRPKYFDTYDEAVEHAELEIAGYLD